MIGSGIVQNDLDALRDLGIVSQLRGHNGAGLYQTKSNPYRNAPSYEQIIKGEDSWMELLLDIDYTNDKNRSSMILKSTLPDLFMGHVRWPTKGDISEDNAHPYLFDNIVGAHNGTLKGSKYEFTEPEDTTTDSFRMFKDVSQRGLITVLKELPDTSSWAISMYDRISKRLYLGRNSKRSLAIGVSQDRQVLYWASDRRFLSLVLGIHGIPFTHVVVPENSLYSINIQTPKVKAFREVDGKSVPFDTPNCTLVWEAPKIPEEIAA